MALITAELEKKMTVVEVGPSGDRPTRPAIYFISLAKAGNERQ